MSEVEIHDVRFGVFVQGRGLWNSHLPVSLVTFGGGRTNVLPGFVHLELFAIFVFLIFVP